VEEFSFVELNPNNFTAAAALGHIAGLLLSV
jgi:hypothetical protein